MEASYNKLVSDLDTRQKHILQLQSQLLRVDYQYGIIVKQLKQKYTKLASDFTINQTNQKQLKKQNKKLMTIIQMKQNQNKLLTVQIQQITNKQSYNLSTLKIVKQQNQMLKNQIKYLQNNQNKYHMKIQQINKKKQIYKQQIMKLQQKIQILQKQIKKLNIKKKQLQQLVQQQVIETQQRIQNIGISFINKNRQQLQQTHKIFQRNQINSKNTINQKNFNKSYSNSNSNTMINLTDQLVNDWETDMKKLKNCVDYGSSYILVFQPSNLDRMISRQIFKFLKKCLKDKSDLQTQLQSLQITHQNAITSHKNILQHLEQQLSKISQDKDKNYRIKIDTQIQTQNVNSPQAQRAVFHLSQLNTKLKIKNSIFIDMIELLALRNVVIQNYLVNSYVNQEYLKNIIKNNKEKSRIQPKPIKINKFRVVSLAIIFIKTISKKQKQQLPQNQLPLKPSQPYQKILKQTITLQKHSINNIYIQKLKQNQIIDNSNIPNKINEIVTFYQFKLKNVLTNKSINKQLVNSIQKYSI